ncbi:MAG: FAD-dependent oxidoreductase [Blautia sp.]|nr:FAD-dependent oxidoreductase [Blautia sp.]MCM1200013.1 FAD-dependent oxidoreductase [Bacteroides fragilis]
MADRTIAGKADLVIIGSGPAGLSAAVYGKRAGFEVLVMEKSPMSGGQVLNTCEVDNYLGMPGIDGFEMGMKFRQHAEKMGVIFEHAEATGITDAGVHKIIAVKDGDTKKVYQAEAVIIATGASHALLQAPGEERLTGHGVSYCATCDGAFFRNKTAAVVGGGDVAVEDAIFLSGICEKVWLIHRRDSLRAAKSLQDALFQCRNVEVLWDSVVEEICGQEKVESLKLRRLKEDRMEELQADGVFIAVGIRPNTELLQNIVTYDEGGYVMAGEDCATQTPGIFAAGDVRSKRLRQIVTAVADGANAVAGVEKYFRERKGRQ